MHVLSFSYVFGHHSKPCGNFGTRLRHKLPIIHPDLPVATRDLNSSVQPELLNPKFLSYRVGITFVIAYPTRPDRLLTRNPPVYLRGTLRQCMLKDWTSNRTLLTRTAWRKWMRPSINKVRNGKSLKDKWNQTLHEKKRHENRWCHISALIQRL